jgi:hypothetical protein
MKKIKYILGLPIALLLSAQAQSSHHYNLRDDVILSGDRVNVDYDLNITTCASQATLIHPQVVITAAHGSIRTQPDSVQGPHVATLIVDYPLNFGNETYRVIRLVEPMNAEPGQNDFCLLFLDRPVNGANICPLAEPLGVVNDFYVHALTHNTFKQIDSIVKPINEQGLLTYGRAYSQNLDPGFWVGQTKITITRPAINPGFADLCVPIGGDSGSTCFISANNGQMALAGVMSTIDGVGNFAEYMLLFDHKDTIERLIGDVLGVRPNLATITSNDWVLQPACLANEVARILPIHFNADEYMRSNPDLLAGFGGLPAEERERVLKSHYLNSGKGEGRVILPRNFNPLLYVSIHPDLSEGVRAMGIADVGQFGRDHYINNGFREGRLFIPADFNPQQYLDLHGDLQVEARTDASPLAWAVRHYALQGFGQNRVYLP